MDKRPTVLIVDDEQINLQVLRGALQSGYNIVAADSGKSALEQIHAHSPDLVLLDVMMPDLSGFEVCKIVKQDEALSGIPIIFLTALDSVEDELQGLAFGGIDYLTKPFNIELLKLRVHNHVELKRRGDLLEEQCTLLANRADELAAALERVKRLEGIIPICMYCKNIRNDQATWQKIETYLHEHLETHFSHGICPECIKEHFPMLTGDIPG